MPGALTRGPRLARRVGEHSAISTTNDGSDLQCTYRFLVEAAATDTLRARCVRTRTAPPRSARAKWRCARDASPAAAARPAWRWFRAHPHHRSASRTSSKRRVPGVAAGARAAARAPRRDATFRLHPVPQRTPRPSRGGPPLLDADRYAALSRAPARCANSEDQYPRRWRCCSLVRPIPDALSRPGCSRWLEKFLRSSFVALPDPDSLAAPPCCDFTDAPPRHAAEPLRLDLLPEERRGRPDWRDRYHESRL